MGRRTDEYGSVSPQPDGDGDGRLSLRSLKTFESFKTPAYRIFFASLLGQWAAMSMQMMARSLLVYRLTGSGAIIGMLALAQAVPQLLIGFLGGAIADRIQKKYIIIISQILTAVISLLVALALSVGYLSEDNPSSWWVLVLTAIGQGSMMGLMMPARMAIIPEIIGEERVMNAISLATMGMYVFRLGGPALAGFLIDAYGFSSIYYLMTGLYAIATVFAIFLPRTSAKTTRRSNPLTDIVEGLRYIRRETVFLLLVVFGVCHMISGMPYQQLLPIFTEDILKVGASGLGILSAVSGAGAVLASLVLASLPNKKRGVLLLLSGVIMGLALIGFSWSRSWALSLAVIPFAALGPTMHQTLNASIVQYYVDPDYRGRMQSFVMMGSGLASLGTFLVGVLSDAVGVEWSVGSMAIFLTIVSFGFLLFARRITRLE